jgi:protein TonB
MIDFTMEPSIMSTAALPASSAPTRMPAQKPVIPPKQSHSAKTETAGIPHALPVPAADAPVAPTPFSGLASPTSSVTTEQPSSGDTTVASHVSSGNETESGTVRNGESSTGTTKTDPASADRGKSAYLREQFTYIRNTVMRRLAYPDHARRMGWSGKVLISFIVAEDGTVHSVKTLKRSGFPLLDSGAVEAVMRAAPFPRPPLRVEVILPVSFRLL